MSQHCCRTENIRFMVVKWMTQIQMLAKIQANQAAIHDNTCLIFDQEPRKTPPPWKSAGLKEIKHHRTVVIHVPIVSIASHCCRKLRTVKLHQSTGLTVWGNECLESHWSEMSPQNTQKNWSCSPLFLMCQLVPGPEWRDYRPQT